MTRTRLSVDLDFGAWPDAIALHPSLLRANGPPLVLPSIVLADRPGEPDILYMMLVLCAKAMTASGFNLSAATLTEVVERIQTFNSNDAIAAALSKQGHN